MVVVPGKAQRVLADRLGGNRLGCSLEHGQRSRRQLWRFTRLAPRLLAFVFAERAGTSIPQEGERVGGAVSVLPLDFHSRSGGLVDLHRLGIVGETGGGIEHRHEFSIARGVQNSFAREEADCGAKVCQTKKQLHCPLVS
jgi:hypothetical protein